MCYTYDLRTQELEPSYIDFNAFVQEHLNHHLEDDLI